MALNDKQSAFVAEYLKDKNATQAAIRAGYSEKTAGQQAHDLLKKPEIASAIEDGLQKLSEKAGVTAERVIQELARLAFSDLRNIVDDGGRLKSVKDWDDATAASVASLEVASIAGEAGSVHKIKVWDKNAALDKLCKHLELYGAEKHEHTGKDGKDLIPETDPADIIKRALFVIAGEASKK